VVITVDVFVSVEVMTVVFGVPSIVKTDVIVVTGQMVSVETGGVMVTTEGLKVIVFMSVNVLTETEVVVNVVVLNSVLVVVETTTGPGTVTVEVGSDRVDVQVTLQPDVENMVLTICGRGLKVMTSFKSSVPLTVITVDVAGMMPVTRVLITTFVLSGKQFPAPNTAVVPGKKMVIRREGNTVVVNSAVVVNVDVVTMVEVDVIVDQSVVVKLIVVGRNWLTVTVVLFQSINVTFCVKVSICVVTDGAGRVVMISHSSRSSHRSTHWRPSGLTKFLQQ
jgi:hypothetical protein